MHTFTDSQLLPFNTTLQLVDETCTVELAQHGECIIRQQFTEQEWLLLNLFFRPSGIHCTYEEALAEHTGEPITVCQERLQAALLKDEHEESRQRETFRAQMQPVRELLLGCRERLHTLNLDISSILHYGYILRPYYKK